MLLTQQGGTWLFQVIPKLRMVVQCYIPKLGMVVQCYIPILGMAVPGYTKVGCGNSRLFQVGHGCSRLSQGWLWMFQDIPRLGMVVLDYPKIEYGCSRLSRCWVRLSQLS